MWSIWGASCVVPEDNIFLDYRTSFTVWAIIEVTTSWLALERANTCDRCNKQRTDLELCSDDLLCRPCEIANAVELTKIQLRRDTTRADGGVAGGDPCATKSADTDCKVDVGTSPACRNPRQQCLSCGSRFDELMDQLNCLNWWLHMVNLSKT